VLDSLIDDMFPFMNPIAEPILEPTQEDLNLFIAQFDAFLASGKTRLPKALPRPVAGEIYKEMCMLLYKQQLGQITFLEMLSQWEEMLGISSPSDSE
jgi:hypothetical protein